jgi:hypothetical protein
MLVENSTSVGAKAQLKCLRGGALLPTASRPRQNRHEIRSPIIIVEYPYTGARYPQIGASLKPDATHQSLLKRPQSRPPKVR